MKSATKNLATQDKSGKTVVHYAVSPLPFGSYENEEMLELLLKEGFDSKLKDNERKTPAMYAQVQES